MKRVLGERPEGSVESRKLKIAFLPSNAMQVFRRTRQIVLLITRRLNNGFAMKKLRS
jgi:hypothetical protein